MIFSNVGYNIGIELWIVVQSDNFPSTLGHGPTCPLQSTTAIEHYKVGRHRPPPNNTNRVILMRDRGTYAPCLIGIVSLYGAQTANGPRQWDGNGSSITLSSALTTSLCVARSE